MSNSYNTGKVVGTLLVGAIAGAALGVLFAPNKGSTTRRRFSTSSGNLAEDIKKQIRNKARDLREKAQELEDIAADKINDYIDHNDYTSEELRNQKKEEGVNHQ